ncbi:hypothetical protein COO60DRAFT_599500 [Scenedesmus sp. NREL 46B-D3]|nr:hypothetical protein COO60DRAFT_599500 [Scenedesmus sp. NREL 46B-D3]
MISPLQHPTAAVSLEQQTFTSHHSTHATFSPESTAVDGPAVDKCGSTHGVCLGHMAPADLAARAISTSVVVEQLSQPTLQLLSSPPAVADVHGDNDDAILTALQLAGTQQQQQHMPPLVASPDTGAAASAPALVEQEPLSNVVAGHGHQANQQHAQQQQQSSSEDDSWTPGQPQSSGGNAHAADADLDDEETWDPNGPPLSTAQTAPGACTSAYLQRLRPQQRAGWQLV